MKLIIQIPCLNEAEHLPTTLADLPREVDGFDEVEWLVVDDGSTDGTADVARAHGVDHVVRFRTNRGLAAAFAAGIDACLRLGADVIVNTDADNQYEGAAVARLVRPILDGDADVVVGDRDTGNVEEFSATKRALQRLGTSVVRRLSRLDVADATSGFRAYDREAAYGLVVTTRYTYTLETLVQAGRRNLALANVPVGRNSVERPSRLFSSTGGYVRRNGLALFRIWSYYSPLRLFWSLAVLFGIAALAVWIPFLIDYIPDGTAGRTQSVILGAVFALTSVQLFSLGLLADQIASLRTITAEALTRVRRLDHRHDRERDREAGPPYGSP
ncbi:MAG: glycosyltransferase family 2 protein [Candidatus Nanopelagicales bacterium]